MSLSPGQRLGSYEIIALLGAGGMGEVYRARDTKLDRDAAIKILNRDIAADPAAIRRFEQEARAASALNHPGIVTIHDIDESEGRLYIVMELVEGVTLRELLRTGHPPLNKVFHIAFQLADALAKAHDGGIVHRDLKPENVMIGPTGHVKILDFGLAKLTGPPVNETVSETPTVALETLPGTLLGTVGYMSPEQASGRTVDFRADQFAFGAVLYEVATGRRAFDRKTPVETLAAIIDSEPERPSSLNPSLPPPLVWTIERCLAKDAADRYAATRDLARELEIIRHRLTDLDAARTSSRQSDARPWARLSVLGATLAALVVGAVLSYVWYRPDGTALATPTFKQLTFRRGFVSNAKFAPDGHTIIYDAAWDGGPMRLFETRSSRPESRSLTLAASTALASISSASELAVVLRCQLDFGACRGTLATMPLSGGAPRELLEDTEVAAWTPDGKALAAVRIAEGEYRLEFPIGKRLFATTGRLGKIAFSPRGDRIAVIEYPLLSEESGAVKIIDLEDRVTTVSSGWTTLRDVQWAPSGDELWVSGSQRGRSCRVYAVSMAGELRVLFQSPGDIILADVFDDGRLLLTHGVTRTRMIWSSAGEERELSWLDWSTVADLSADGSTVLFYEWGEGAGAVPAVYVRRVDGSDATRLGDGKALALSPDGRWALALQETTRPRLVLLPTGTGQSQSLPAGDLTDFYWARWFPDSRRLLLVASGPDGIPRSYMQEIETGRLEPVAEQGMLAVLVSPDGRRILAGDPLGGYYVWPIDGGEPVPLKGLDPQDRPIRWSADGRFLYVHAPDEARVRVYRHDLTTGRRQPWTELAPRDPTGVFGVATGRGELAITPDGKSSVFTYWTVTNDLFLVEGLRP